MGKSKYLDFKIIKKHTRELRGSLTDSEELLWKEFRNRRLSGYKFLRQHPIIFKADFKRLNYFIADFYCDEKKTVVELDGPIHEATVEYDEFRDAEMRNLGIHVLRLKNDKLLNIKKTLQRIKNYLNAIQ